ncbi:hypothetical protein FACS18948_2640 [Clostridia bacterium]|nr:hypothetical protein FACS18948_2640 [Clostridia bacterium]
MIEERIRDASVISRMLGEIAYIFKKTEGIDEICFLGDEDLQHMVCMSLIIIGECANNLSEEFKETHAAIPWVQIVAVRNIAAHGYWQLDMRQIWKALVDDLPELDGFLQNVTI